MPNEHQHEWRKTGEYFAMNPPKFVVVCEGCSSLALRMDHWPMGEVEAIREVQPGDYQWAHLDA